MSVFLDLALGAAVAVALLTYLVIALVAPNRVWHDGRSSMSHLHLR